MGRPGVGRRSPTARSIGAVLDRNGLRPSRYVVTNDGRVIMASEVGALEIAPGDGSCVKGRLEPGKMFLVDLEKGRIVDDEELKHRIASAKPYGKWLERVHGAARPTCRRRPTFRGPTTTRCCIASRRSATRSKTSNTSSARWRSNGEEAIGSMGTDTPLAVLSDRAQPLFNYFKQLFAQVTNPPLDAIREELVTSVFTGAGGEGNLLEPEARKAAGRSRSTCRSSTTTSWPGSSSSTAGAASSRHVCRCSSRPPKGATGMERALESLVREGRARRSSEGANLIILSDRGVDPDIGADPLAAGLPGLHHHLVRKGMRTRAGLVIECGDAREVHHFALLLGYGAGTINPYVAFETLDDMVRQGCIKRRSTTPRPSIATARRSRRGWSR